VHPPAASLRIQIMSAPLIALVALAGLYVALNLRRLLIGRSWAFTVCQIAKEWEQRDRARRQAAREQPTSHASKFS